MPAGLALNIEVILNKYLININPVKPSVHILVKHTLKFWQFLLQNAQVVSNLFVDASQYRSNLFLN